MDYSMVRSAFPINVIPLRIKNSITKTDPLQRLMFQAVKRNGEYYLRAKQNRKSTCKIFMKNLKFYAAL